MAKIKKKYKNEYLIKCNYRHTSFTRWWIRYKFPQFGRLKINKDKTYTFYTDNNLQDEYTDIDIIKIR